MTNNEDYTIVYEGNGEWGVKLNGRVVISGIDSVGDANELADILNNVCEVRNQD